MWIDTICRAPLADTFWRNASPASTKAQLGFDGSPSRTRYRAGS